MNGVDLLESVKDENRDSLYVSSWADSIRENVVGWLTEKGYANTSDVFTNEKTDGDIAALIAEYNKSYNSVMNA